jgi:hypothetical protein
MYLAVHYCSNFILHHLSFADKINQLLSVTVGIGLGIIVYGVIVYLFKLEESELVLAMIKKKLPGFAR